jgi:hypothetical protein
MHITINIIVLEPTFSYRCFGPKKPKKPINTPRANIDLDLHNYA